METLLGRRVVPNKGSASPRIGRWIDRGSRSLLLLSAGLLAVACEQAPTLPTPEPTAARLDVASTQTVGVPTSFVSGLDANRCMSVPNAKIERGTQLVLGSCDDEVNQQFIPQSNGEIRMGELCVDAYSAQGRDGDAIVLWTCNGGANQKWSLTDADEIRGINGKCIDVYGARNENGAKLVLWSCHGGANQKWDAGTQSSTIREPSASSESDDPELPRVFLSTRSVASTGRTISVPAGGNLQNAINSAVPGDQIVLQAGATYTGNFSLPAKSGSGWIVIRSSATLPTEGTRITPAQAGLLPKLVSPNSGKTVYTKSGAHHYRLVGLEITHASGVTGANTPVDFGSGSSNMILDRSYVHGNSRLDLRRCVVLNSARSAVIDSYLSRCHSRSYDSQAIISWNSPGPLKIVNNYLEGAGENIMFGGATPSTNVLPSDIEIRGNHFFKPLEWRTSGTWLVKNLLEVKFGQRILLEGNVFENNWSDGQDGSALNIKRSASSTCTWCVTQDITLRNNVVRGSTNGIRVASTKRFLIENNLFHKLSGKMFILLGGLENLTVRHNTGFAPSYIAMADGSAQKGFVFRDNLMSRGNYGIKGSGKGEGYYTFNYYMPGYSVAGNVLIGAPASRYPAGNFFPAEKTDVGFVSLSGEDYRLGSGSRYSDKATDGTDPGADFSALLDATDGVVR